MVYNVQSHIPLNGLIRNWPNQLFHVSAQVEIANSGSHHLEPIDVAQGPTLMVPKLDDPPMDTLSKSIMGPPPCTDPECGGGVGLGAPPATTMGT